MPYCSLLHLALVTDAEVDTMLKRPSANGLDLVTQDLLFSAIVSPSGRVKCGEAEELCCLEKSLADLASTLRKELTEKESFSENRDTRDLGMCWRRRKSWVPACCSH